MGKEPEYKQKLDAWIDAHTDEMIGDLKTLVRINSVRGEAKEGMPYGEGPAAVVAAMEKLMASYGLSVTNYENYCVTGDLNGAGEKALDILAHLDVVPVSEDWTETKPFEPLVVGDRIYGRGTCDDKGPGVAALYAVRAVKELGFALKRGVRLVYGSDEECGSSDLEYYYSKEKEAEYTFSPDANFPLINIEKARLSRSFCAEAAQGEGRPALVSIEAGSKANVVPGKAEAVFEGLKEEDLAKAVKQLEEETGVTVSCTSDGGRCSVELKGAAGHAASPAAGNNALTALLRLIELLPLAAGPAADRMHALARLFPHGDWRGEALKVAMSDEESGSLTLSLDVLNYKDGKIEGIFDCRAPLCATEENLTCVMRKALAEAGFSMEEGGMTPAHAVSADSFFVRTLLDCYELYSGRKGKTLAIGGGTYVHELERGVAFGCAEEGVDTHMHGDDEYMKISIMVMSAKIFADAILRLCM